MEPLEVVNLSRRKPLSSGWLLEDISLAVPAGRITMISGPSGSGKTLLLRAMALLDPVDSGEVRFRGEPPRRDRVPNFRRRVSYFHQRPVLLGPSVEAALAQPFSLGVRRGHRFDHQRAAAMLAILGRDEGFLAKRTADLSGGELQVAALVRAVSLDPAVLLLDEPTAAMDPETAQAAERWLADWITESPEDRAIVWVSHDSAQVARLGQKPFWMDNGRLTPQR